MKQQSNGMKSFLVIWAGQFVSLLGTTMTTFAMTLWAYETTGLATPLAMINFCFMIPIVVLGPFTGVLVDRYNRKLMMMVSDLAAAVSSLIILILFSMGTLQIWHLYITALLSGTFQGFQFPAYSAAASLMLPKKDYSRANGLMSLAQEGSLIFAPIMAGLIIGVIGIQGILLIDLISVGIAVSTLLIVKIPTPPKEIKENTSTHFFKEAIFGFQYILTKPGLLWLQCIFLVENFFFGFTVVLLAPMILGRCGGNEIILASLQSSVAVGGVLGALLMSFGGGPRSLVHGVLLGWALGCLIGQLLLGFGQSQLFWMIGLFCLGFSTPIINGCNQAIWQSKVPPQLQGRVFSVRQCIALMLNPLSALIAGPIADDIFEPAMMKGGALASYLGPFFGEGKGAGIALIFVVSGIIIAIIGFSGYLISAVRRVETIVPDHQMVRTAC